MNRDLPPLPAGLRIAAPISAEFAQILTPEALAFVAKLHRQFESRRQELLARRAARQKEFDAGALPDFLADTKKIRDADWQIAPQPKDMLDRRVEITGPTDRKMVINALNCGAATFMADFEDANCPTWFNMIDGQVNLRDAVRRTITLESGGKSYKLNEKTAVLLPRPRGWHLDEKHVTVDGKPVAGGIFDFALYFFHNAKELLARGSGPYFYLPKMESHLEARLWNEIFVLSQEYLGLPKGTIKATCLIETVVAAFEMDEFLWELKDHSAGLNIGRWDYIFSCIKKFRANKDFCLADRAQVTMTAPFMRSYALLLVKTCHRRGAPAMGGMAAQIPIKNDPAANEAALEKVRQDKLREVTDGCDGTWIAHPALVPIAKEVFDKHMPQPNQYGKQRPDVNVAAKDLLDVPAVGADHRGRRAQQHLRRHPVPGRLARGQRLRAGVQPDGRRGDRGNLTLADLAVDPLAQGRAGRRTQGHRRAVSAAAQRGAAESARLPGRRSLEGRQVRGGSKTLRDDHRWRLCRISHPTRLQRDRLVGANLSRVLPLF